MVKARDQPLNKLDQKLKDKNCKINYTRQLRDKHDVKYVIKTQNVGEGSKNGAHLECVWT